MKNLLSKILNTNLEEVRTSAVLLGYRVLISLSMIFVHGWKKVVNFEQEILNIPDPFGIGGYPSALMAIFGNVIAPIFVIIGLGTRLMVLPILAITLTGFFLVHFNDPWAVKDVPYIYSLGFLLILLLGPGRYSLDHNLLLKDRST